jgi:hypothetical protein
MAATSITIVLELDETTDSPFGSARLPDGRSREFHGWLGLAKAIDALAGTARSHPLGSSPDFEEHRNQSEGSSA